jgi:hypothetical protein
LVVHVSSLSPAVPLSNDLAVITTHWQRFCFLVVMMCGGFTTPVHAQDSVVVEGAVRARSGQPLSGVDVRVTTGNTRPVTTNAMGWFRLILHMAIDQPGSHQVQFALVGFVPETTTVRVNTGQPRIALAVTLTPLAQLAVQQVVAQRERPLLHVDDGATGGSVERAEAIALPTDARDPMALAFTIPGVAQARAYFGDAPKLTLNGGNALFVNYAVDGMENTEGFLGGPRVEFPLAALHRLTVIAEGAPVTSGRSASGHVDVESRTGSAEWTGEVFLYNRPGIPFDARPKLVPVGQDPEDFRAAQEGFRRTQLGAAGGGPLIANKTYGFGALEYTTENEDRISSTARATFVGREVRETYKTFARIDHGWNDRQTTTVRFAMSHQARAGKGSGIVAPEADITTIRFGSLTALSHRTALADGRASNTISAQLGTYSWNFPPTASDLQTPQVTILDRDSIPIGVVGSSNFVFDESERQVQVRDVFERQINSKHTVRVGADMVRSQFSLTGASTNPVGAYEVVNEGNIPVVNGRYRLQDIPSTVFVRSYTIDAAQKQVDLTQSLYAAFVEDLWRPTSSLTLRTGVRWDYDDLTSRGNSTADLTNIQPRASLTWWQSPRLVWRGGVGMHSGRLPYAVYSDAIQFGPEGNQTVTFRGSNAPRFLQGPQAVNLDRSSLPPREVRELFALGVKSPRSWQATLGVQREWSERLVVALDAVWVQSHNLPRSWDLNASTRTIGIADTIGIPVSEGDVFRPTLPVAGGFRRVTTTESGGRATYGALYSVLRYRAANALAIEANWVWSHAITNTEDINFNATVGNDFHLDRADANNDRRHKITTRAVWTGRRHWTVSGIVDFQTGTPINRIANFRDLTGSGGAFGDGFIGNYQRYFGVPRNGERLPSAVQANISVARALTFGLHQFAARLDVFNVFNRLNSSGYATGVGGGGSATQIGRPGDPVVFTTAGPPRQLQLSLHWTR